MPVQVKFCTSNTYGYCRENNFLLDEREILFRQLECKLLAQCLPQCHKRHVIDPTPINNRYCIAMVNTQAFALSRYSDAVSVVAVEAGNVEGDRSLHSLLSARRSDEGLSVLRHEVPHSRRTQHQSLEPMTPQEPAEAMRPSPNQVCCSMNADMHDLPAPDMLLLHVLLVAHPDLSMRPMVARVSYFEYHRVLCIHYVRKQARHAWST